MVDRTELRRLAEAATPGPWRKRWYGSGGYEGREGVTVVTNTGTINCDEIAYLGRGDIDEDTAQRSRNGAFIAAASPDMVLGLLDEIERQKAWAQQMALADVEHLRDVAVRLKGALTASLEKIGLLHQFMCDAHKCDFNEDRTNSWIAYMDHDITKFSHGPAAALLTDPSVSQL